MGLFAILAVYAGLRADEAGARPCVAPTGRREPGGRPLEQRSGGLFPLSTPIVAGLTLRRQRLGKSLAMNAALLGCSAPCWDWFSCSLGR